MQTYSCCHINSEATSHYQHCIPQEYNRQSFPLQHQLECHQKQTQEQRQIRVGQEIKMSQGKNSRHQNHRHDYHQLQQQQQQQQQLQHNNSTASVLQKLSSFSKRRSESERRKVAERELDNLNSKIDKLLSKMGEPEAEAYAKLKLEEECVVCLAAPATMQTFPCGHKVVCRKCLIKTIQVAVSQRCLPLRCVICRDRILRLQHTTKATAPLTPEFTTARQEHQHGNKKPNGSTNECGISPCLDTRSAVGPGCVAAVALTLTPIVFRSLTSTEDIKPPLTAMTPRGHSRASSSTFKSSKVSPILQPFCKSEQVFESHTSPKNGCTSSNVDRCEDDSYRRSSPTSLDMQAFLHSHNDALNLQSKKSGQQEPHNNESGNFQKMQKPKTGFYGHHSFHGNREPVNTGIENLDVTRFHGQGLESALPDRLFGNALSSPTPTFRQGKVGKVYPETTAPLSAFAMTSSHDMSESVSNNYQPSSKVAKSNVSASKFISRLVPKSGKRKHSWFRHD